MYASGGMFDYLMVWVLPFSVQVVQHERTKEEQQRLVMYADSYNHGFIESLYSNVTVPLVGSYTGSHLDGSRDPHDEIRPAAVAAVTLSHDSQTVVTREEMSIGPEYRWSATQSRIVDMCLLTFLSAVSQYGSELKKDCARSRDT